MSKSGSVVSESYLVLNQPSRGTRVSTHIQRELQYCDSFRFYVAFVTQDGIASLLQALNETQSRNVRGKILVSQYLNFTPPLALRTLLKFPAFNVRIASDGAMHAKGYYFIRNREQVEHYLIGSSNWTARALSTNTELNIQVATPADSALAREVGSDFDVQFSHATRLTAKVIEAYTITYEKAKQAVHRSPGLDLRSSDLTGVLKPNGMQLAALRSLAKSRDSGKSKALIISATGTGNINPFTAVTNAVVPVSCQFTVVPFTNNCSGAPTTFSITVNPIPTINSIPDIIQCGNVSTNLIQFQGSIVQGTIYQWTNNNISIGLGSSGSGNIASFTASN
jgi:HKD family nuclease